MTTATPITADQIAAIRARADRTCLHEAAAAGGMTLTHAQADDLGEEAISWLGRRYDMRWTTDDDGVTFTSAARFEARCECGAWSGEACPWSGFADDLVRVTYVPAQHRATATNGRTWVGLTRTIRVSPECRDNMVECDAEWIDRG